MVNVLPVQDETRLAPQAVRRGDTTPNSGGVSVIVASLNRGDLLAKTLDSVLRQDIPGLDLIVVDGGSTDTTLKVAEEYAHRCHWISADTENVAQAVNLGLQRARGDIIGWLNADDRYYDEALHNVRNFFDKHPTVDVVYGDANLLDAHGDFLCALRTKDWKPQRLKHRCCLAPSAVFFRRRVLDKCGVLDSTLRFWADYEYWLRLAKNDIQFARLPMLLSACLVRSAPSSFGLRNRERSPEAAVELNDMFVKKLGKVPARWLLHYARTTATHEATPANPSNIYDLSVFKQALYADQHWNHASKYSPGSALRLGMGHLFHELRRRGQRPEVSRSLLPPWLRQYATLFVKRRIFKLHQHKPCPLTIPAYYHRTEAPTDAPLISIVTPNLNQGCYIEATIDSVTTQRYPRLELIVQDGASNDDSVSVLERRTADLKHWESVKDKGQANAINLGMRHATGEIMAYLNSDDLLLPGSLNFVARYFQEHPDVDVVYGHRVLVNEAGEEIGRWVLPQHDSDTLPWADYIPQETMFWRRRAWDKVGAGLDESFQFAMDWDLILRFREAGLKFARLPRFLGAFRISTDQKTMKLLETVGRREMERIRQRFLGFVPSGREVRKAIRSYVWRHWWCDKLYLAGLVKY